MRSRTWRLALTCLARFDEVVVLDSYSTDRTVEIAERHGARVVQREFDNFSAHKNWALDNIQLRNEWVMFVDADERVERGLADEIDRIVLENNPAFDGYFVARQIYVRRRVDAPWRLVSRLAVALVPSRAGALRIAHRA